MWQIDKLCAVARAEIGTREYPEDSNRQKYGEAYGWNGVPWCVQFIWWCFMQAGLQGLFYGGRKTASCSELLGPGEAAGGGRGERRPRRRGLPQLHARA